MDSDRLPFFAHQGLYHPRAGVAIRKPLRFAVAEENRL
jgi:hypothetical protein